VHSVNQWTIFALHSGFKRRTYTMFLGFKGASFVQCILDIKRNLITMNNRLKISRGILLVLKERILYLVF